MLLRVERCQRFRISLPACTTLSDLLAGACMRVAAVEEEIAAYYAQLDRQPQTDEQRFAYCALISHQASTMDLEQDACRLRCRLASFCDQLLFMQGAYARWRAMQRQLCIPPRTLVCLDRVLQRDELWLHPTVVPSGLKSELKFLPDNDAWKWPVGMAVLIVNCPVMS